MEIQVAENYSFKCLWGSELWESKLKINKEIFFKSKNQIKRKFSKTKTIVNSQ